MSRKKVGAGLVSFVVVIALASITAVAWWFYNNTKPVVSVTPITADVVMQPMPSADIAAAPPVPVWDAEALQKAVTDWSDDLQQAEQASVVIADKNGSVLAKYNESGSYFTASLYKLFVAYEGYRAVDAGVLDLEKNFQGRRSVAECLDLMIRESDSPCGERMWTELGKTTIDKALEAYGITETDMVGLQTSASDTAIILARIARGEGLSNASKAAYLDSMRDQPALYRRGLPSGFTDKVVVYNKVGWNEQLEWHDAAIIERADGERLIVAVLTSGVGSKKIAELATTLESLIVRNE